jgi:hypothetical protein
MPTHPLRRWAHWLCINDRFEGIMVGVVAANAVCLALAHYGMTSQFSHSLTVVRRLLSQLMEQCLQPGPCSTVYCTHIRGMRVTWAQYRRPITSLLRCSPLKLY